MEGGGVGGSECDPNSLCAAETAFEIDPTSPGRVANEEPLLRASYKQHYPPGSTDKSLLKVGFIREGELRDGHLSVWRRQNLLDQTVHGCRAHLEQQNPSGGLVDVFEATAQQLRSSWGPDYGRVISVRDDTVAKPDGTRDKAHASLAVCERLNGQAAAFEYTRRTLIEIFRANPLAA
jgi:hypothetical protein